MFKNAFSEAKGKDGKWGNIKKNNQFIFPIQIINYVEFFSAEDIIQFPSLFFHSDFFFVCCLWGVLIKILIMTDG